MGSENGRPDEQPVHRVTFVVSEEASAMARLEAPKAEADFQQARRELKRTKDLWESNLASRAEYGAAQDRYVAAKAKLDSLRTETGPYGFYIGKYEVTQAQWQAVMGNNPSHFKNRDNCPVESVSWNDVQEFLDKLNDRNDGFRYRLPTEAEWEFASRAATQVTDDATYVNGMAWHDKNSGGKTHPVGQLSPNQFQLHDMLGNVWEWCLDWYHETYNGAPTDGSAQLTQKGVEGFTGGARVLRGGSYQVDPFDLRPSSRYRYAPDHRYMGFGFRVVAARSPAKSITTDAKVAMMRANSGPRGSRIAITADRSLNDYEAYHRGERFYVMLPVVDIQGADVVRGPGFSDVKVLRSANGTVVSFLLMDGWYARVEQRANQLDVVFRRH